MSGPWDDYKDSTSSASDKPWEQFGGKSEEKKPAGALRKAIGDKVVGFASGAVGATKALADAAGAGNSVSNALDSATNTINDYLSPEEKASQQVRSARTEQAKGTGVWNEFKTGVQNFAESPVQQTVSGLGSVVPVALAAVGGLPAAAATGIGMGVGTVKGRIYDDTKKRGIDAGLSESDAQAAATNAQDYTGENADQIALGGALGAADALTGVGRIAGGALRNAIMKPAVSALPKAVERRVVGRAAMGALGEVPLEATQGGQEQLATNIAAQRQGVNVDTWAGVAGQATEEGLASLGSGAGFGVAHSESKAPQPTNTPGTPPPAPPAQPGAPAQDPAQLGYDPMAGTHTVFPDGSVVLNSDASNGAQTVRDMQRANRLANVGQDVTDVTPNPVRDQVAQAAAQGGALSGAALVALDTGAHQAQIDQQTSEADQAAYDAYMAEQDTTDKPITHGPIAEVAMSDEDKRAVLYSNQPVVDGGQKYAGTQDGDILNGMGAPFATRFGAQRRARMEGSDWTIAPVFDGFVARRKDANVSNDSGVRPVPATSGGQDGNNAPASVGSGSSDGNGLGANAAGSQSGGVDRAGKHASGVPASPVAKDSNVKNTAPAASGTKAKATPDQAPKAVAGDAATAGKLPGAGSVAVEGGGVNSQDSQDSAAAPDVTALQKAVDEARAAWQLSHAAPVSEKLKEAIAALEAATQPADGVNTPVSNRSNPAPAAVAAAKKPAPGPASLGNVKADMDHLFGIDQKRAKAIERIAKGTAYFGKPLKAQEFIAANGLKDTHQAVKTDRGWDVVARAKPVSQPQEQTSAKTPEAVKAEAQPEAGTTAGVSKPATGPGVGGAGEGVSQSIAGRNGPHFAQGQVDFKDGKPRVLPSYFTNTTGKNAKDWYRGWDAANVAAPVEKPAAKKGLGEQLAELNAALERQGATQDANTRARRDSIRKQIAEQDFPEILKAVDDNLDTAEELSRAFQYAGDEPKAKTIERVLKKRGITPEYQTRWTERLLGSQKPATVNVPPTVSEAFTAQMQKQKGRITRLKNEADKAGSLEDKRAAQLKATAAEATLRQMRLKIFDAEDAAVKAVDAGDTQAFAEYADLFPGAAEEIAKLTGQNDELDAEMQSYEAKKNPTYSGEPNQPLAPAQPEPNATKNIAKQDEKAALSEKEKAAKAKMFNALGKLATLAGKNTRMNWTQEEEQQLLPIVIELFDGAMELGAVTFQQAVAYVREFISTNLDQETADAIPFDTLQGAYISVAGRHKDKGVTSKKDVVSFESLAELGTPGPEPENTVVSAEAKSDTSAKPSLNGPEGRHAIAQSVADHFIGGGKFDTIIQARKFISELTGEKIESSSKNAKLADETIEMGVVLAGREMVKAGRNQKRSDQTIYDRLVSLYNAQPNLSVRSSTSVEQQAYSTPIPLAFVASRLAKIKKGDIVAEPTAGNSALVLEVLPAHTVINELNDDRIGNLKAMGFTPTQKNAATEQLAAPKSVDAAVINPPFGAVKDGEGKTIYFDVPAGPNTPALNTREIDHAIVFNSLSTIKDDGRAVLIVGGVDASSEDQIREGYRGKGKREFYYKLYNEYKVTDHFTVDGGLYSRQGAGYPVDVIVIDGRGKSARDLPAANLPQRIMSYDQLKEKLNEANSLVPAGSGTGVRVGSDPTGVSHGTDVATSSIGAPDGPGIEGAKPGQIIQTGSQGDGVRLRIERPTGGGAVSGGEQLGATGTTTQSDAAPRGGLVAPAGVGGESGRKTGDGGNRPDDVGANSGIDGKLLGSGLTDRRGQEAETENQVGYTPKSGKASVGTLVPVNMRDAIQESLSKVADDVGDLDDYVAKALGYTSQELGDYLSAEQIDALALAIYNAEQGKGFIIGDQTGIGKGRVNAAMIRYAIKKGQVPIFITEKPNLYADMIRDLDDIGMAKDLDLEGGKPHILMTNNGESIPYELYRNVNGEVVEHKLTLKAPKSNAKDAAALLAELAGNGELGRYKVIFSTYSQLQSIAGKATERQRFLTAFAKDNFIIFDESHNAGGTGEAQDSRAITKVMKASGMTVPGRAGFARNLVKLAKGTFFSSATYAKRPDVMDLYSSTNMSLAVDKPADLAPAIKAGGVPLQQAVATMLTADGQYIRRERTFAGVSYETQLMPIDRQTGENMAESMRWILAFSRAKEALLKQMQKEFDKEGAIAQNMGGEKTQVAGADFGAGMHSLIDQMLLALKVEESVKLAIAKLKSGEKVVLTVSNTMGSFLKDYADEMGIRPGDAVSLSFKDLYLRYLDKQRKYKVKSPGGTVEEKYLSDAELGHLLPMHNKIQAFIQNAGFSNAPISPIDYMHNALRKAGYKTDEITGRKLTIDYEGGIAKLATRNSGIRERLKAIGDFNSGAADVLILNQSGSTGLSLHASAKFKDQKKRHMIIVQAEKNIDTHMQMLGRVHRTGQVVTPGYTQAMADTPAEMRPAAVLSKKMAGLSANTTASRKSAVAAEGVVDFINEYGGQVAAEFLLDNPEVHDALGGQKRIEVPSDLNEAGEELIRKLTGYIPILPLKQQEQIYADLIERYNDLIARENSMGTNKLETKALDLDAKTLTSEKITANKGSATETSVFAEPANMELVDVKRNVKPLTPQELEAAINETLNGLTPQQYNTSIAKEFDSDLAKYVADVLEKMAVTTDNHALVQGQKKDQLFLMGQNIKRVLSIYKVGDSVTITDKNASVVHGVITGITHNQKTKNPAAGSAWKMTFALANGDARTMSVGFGQLGQQFSVNVTPGTVPQVTADGKVDRVMIRSLFENGNNIRREKRWMVTGNLLAGFSKYQGQIVSYTKADGGTGRGVLMNRQFDYKKEKGASTLSFSTSAQAIEFLTKAGRNAVLGTPDRVLRIVSLGNDRYSVMVPSSKREGGSLYLDRGLLDAFGSDFYKQGQNMSMRIDGNDTLERGLNYLIAERDDVSLAALTNQDVARKVLGMDDPAPAAFSRPRFSRNAQSQANTSVERLATGIASHWDNAPKIVVAFDMDDERIPERVRMEDQKQRSGGASGAPEGFYYKGTVYLMASKLSTDEDVARVLFHEALGHHGLRMVFGKSLKSILNRVALARKAEVDAKMRQYGLKGISKVDRLTAAEEVLAEMAQNTPTIGFVREAIAAIRTWLRENVPGFNNLRLSDAELIRNYILPARAFVERGGDGTPNGGFPVLSRVGQTATRSDVDWYSELSRQVLANKSQAMPSKEWASWVNSLTTKGVKPDEIQWSGVQDWLKTQDGKVTKAQVAEYLDANGIQVTETVLGDMDSEETGENKYRQTMENASPTEFADEVDYQLGEEYQEGEPRYDLIDRMVEQLQESFSDADSRELTSHSKYGQYQLPGGTNYREVLLTLPVKQEKRYSIKPDGGIYRVYDPEGEIVKSFRTFDEAEKYRENILGDDGLDTETTYQSGHWKETPNVLAHIRVNDRTDAEGKRVLFVEEIQSDWGQRGKKDGFGGGTHKAGDKFTVMRNGEPRSVTALKNTENNLTLVEDGNGSRFNVGSGEGVPQAPFVTHTDKWLALALKRIVKLAVDGGYDRVAFVNGQQSADRYDLSKQISAIEYEPTDEGNYEIKARDLDGTQVLHEDDVPLSRVEELVGKDLAKKIEAGEGEKNDGKHGYRNWHTLSGLDLKVGGEGMKAFYDKIVPTVAKDVLRKVGGGQMEPVRILIAGNKVEAGGMRTGAKRVDQPGFAITEAMRDKAAGGMPMFSRSIGDTLTSAANSARDVNLPAGYKVGDLFNSVPGKLNWWHKTVGTQYNLAQRSKPFKRVYDSVQNFINDVSYFATEAADLAPNILPKLESWKDIAKSPLSAEDTQALSKPVFDGTLTWARDESGKPVKMTVLEDAAKKLTPEQKAQRLLRGDHISANVLKMWQGLPIDQYESLIEGKYESDMLKAGIVFTPAELKALFGLNDKQVSLYQEFRKAIDKSLTNLAVADMLRFGGKDVEPIRAQVLDTKTVGEAAEMLRDYLLSVAGDNGVLVDTANKMIDKGDKAQDLIDRGYAPLSRFGTYTLDVVDAEGERAYFGMFESAAEASKMRRKMEGLYPGAAITQGTVSEQAYKMFAGVSPETLELFGDMLGLESQGDGAASQAFQEYLKLAKSSRSAMKRLIQRKGIAGFSEDAGRVLAGFVYSNARQTASSLHMGEMTNAANDIDKTQGELKDAAVKLVDYIKTPQEEAQKLRGLLFAQYIGGSVASAMVNMTQPVTMTFPWLSQYGGVASAAKQMTAAMKDSGKKTTGDAKLDAALHRAEEDGTVSPQEVHQLMAQSQGRGALQSGDGTRTGDALAKANNVLSKVSLAWGKLFGVAEQFNRRVTFIAAYRTAVSQGMADPDGFARKAIAETQGVYNKGNKPSWARGAVGSTLFTFKQYSIAYVEMLSRMAGNGPEGKKAALLALGVLFLLSGAGGMPGADDLDDVISGAMQSLGYNFDSKMKRKEFFVGLLGEGGAEFMERGVSGLPGVPIDVSGRMGLGNLVPGTGLFTKKADHTRDVAELAGPAGDFVKRGFDAAGKLITGDVAGAVDSVSPKAIQNLTQAYDMANRGMYRDAKGMKVLDTDGYDALVKAIGFQPTDVKRAQDANFEVTRMIGLNKINETDIANRWAMGVFEKDASKIQDARDDLAEWNRANPESPIRIDFKQIRSRVQKMNETKAQRISKTAPREIRAAVRQELASAQ